MRGLEEIGRYIMNNKVSTLQLNGEDAYNFAHSLLRPSKETIERIKNSHIAIDNIVISRSDNGFEAEIEELDLSFLDEVPNKKDVTLETLMFINISGVVNKFYVSDSNINIANSVKYISTIDNESTTCDENKYSDMMLDKIFVLVA